MSIQLQNTAKPQSTYVCLYRDTHKHVCLYVNIHTQRTTMKHCSEVGQSLSVLGSCFLCSLGPVATGTVLPSLCVQQSWHPWGTVSSAQQKHHGAIQCPHALLFPRVRKWLFYVRFLELNLSLLSNTNKVLSSYDTYQIIMLYWWQQLKFSWTQFYH